MFKFLRKYNKYILAVGGTLLLIVFLVGSSLPALMERISARQAVWATIGPDDEEVGGEELARAQQDMRFMQERGMTPPGFSEIESPAHWYLLTREANQAGFVGGLDLAALPPEIAANFEGQGRQLLELAGRVDGVRRMLATYSTAGKLSDRRMENVARRLFHAVSARIVPIEATARDHAPVPTEAELQAQLDAYKDVAPGEGEHGFGYLQPDRFKIEWISVPAASIRAVVESSAEMNGVALHKHWQRNPNNRQFPEYVDGAVEIPDEVRTDLLDMLTARKRDTIEHLISGRIKRSLLNLEAPTGYYELPEDWAEQRVDFVMLAEELTQEPGLEGLKLPEYMSIGDRWLIIDDLSEFEELSRGWSEAFGGNVGARQFILALREFKGEPTYIVQEGVAAPALRTGNRNDPAQQGVLVFRITATDPSRPPHDVDEIRDQLVSDLRRLADYETIAARVSEIESLAQQDGLLAVALEHDAEVRNVPSIAVYNPGLMSFFLEQGSRLQPLPTNLPIVGMDIETIQEILDRALARSHDGPLADLPRAERTFVLPVEDKLAVLVIELTGEEPVSRELYDQLVASGQLQLQVLTEEATDVAVDFTEAFSFESLKKRLNFEVILRDEDEDDGEGDVAADDSLAAAG